MTMTTTTTTEQMDKKTLKNLYGLALPCENILCIVFIRHFSFGWAKNLNFVCVFGAQLFIWDEFDCSVNTVLFSLCNIPPLHNMPVHITFPTGEKLKSKADLSLVSFPFIPISKRLPFSHFTCVAEFGSALKLCYYFVFSCPKRMGIGIFRNS